MEKFEEIKERIVGKIYERKYVLTEVYVIAEVYPIRKYEEIEGAVIGLHVLYIKVSVPSKRITTSFKNINETFQVKIEELSFDDMQHIEYLKTNYIESEMTLDDVVNCYRLINTNIKELLCGIGAKF